MTLSSAIAQHGDDLTSAEARVARFMAAHPHSVGHLSASRLAAEIETSDATVIRTVRKLGYDGLAALREALAVELSMAGRLDASLAEETQAPGSLGRLVQERVEMVGSLPQRVGTDVLARAVETLDPARRIWVVGFGPAGHLADYAVQQFRRTGADASAMTTTGRGFVEDLALLASGDVVLVMAYDAISAEIDLLLDRGAKLQVPIIQLTEDSHTGDPRATIVIGSGRGNPLHAPSHAATIVVLEALVLALAAGNSQRTDLAGELLAGLRHQLDSLVPGGER